ncbi:MAG TPA: LPS export ABC transporter permease LptG, partial [Candidatus Methylomirabilis sp.]|nr:LPS export ABC transporter permease LptG [Candidatus Methylomirabilis sp.]
MRLLDRYIARESLKLLCLCLVVFLGAYVIVDLFEKFSKFLEARVQPALIVRYYLSSLPAFLLQVLPVAVLISSLLTLGGLARNNELLAMKMGHVSTLRIALPCIAVGLAASLTAWLTAESLVPWTSERALNIWRTQVSRLPAHRLTRESDIWYRAQGNRFVHISLIDPSSGLIRGMSIFELAPDFDLLRRVDARAAVWGKEAWTLREGYRLELDQAPVQIEPFEELVVPLKERPEDFARVARAPEEMSYAQLREYVERLARSGVSVTRYRVDLHAKVAIALASLVMALIGVSFGLRIGKAGIMAWVGACIPTGLLYWLILGYGFQFGRAGVLPPLVAAWLPNLLF